MSRNTFRPLWAIALILGLAALALPGKAHAFRCGNKLVVEGDTAGAVLAKCGPPTEVTRKSIQRPPIFWRNGRPWRVPGGDLEVTVEIWTYNFGSSRLMQRLRLEDGEVRQIKNLGYGYN